MISSQVLEKYLYAFTHLSVKVTNGSKAPNKAVMLISVIDLIRLGYVEDNCIYLDEAIEDAFEHNWQTFFPKVKPPTPWTPFWHLKREPFWHFMPINYIDEVENLVPLGGTASLNKMLSVICYAYIDEELYELIQDRDCRQRLMTGLIETYIRI